MNHLIEKTNQACRAVVRSLIQIQRNDDRMDDQILWDTLVEKGIIEKYTAVEPCGFEELASDPENWRCDCADDGGFPTECYRLSAIGKQVLGLASGLAESREPESERPEPTFPIQLGGLYGRRPLDRVTALKLIVETAARLQAVVVRQTKSYYSVGSSTSAIEIVKQAAKAVGLEWPQEIDSQSPSDESGPPEALTPRTALEDA